MASNIQIYTLADIEQVIQSEDFCSNLIQGIEAGFLAFAKGDFHAAPIQTLGLPPYEFACKKDENYAAQTCVKTGYFKNSKHYVIKVASGGHPMPNSGLLQVYSQHTGKLQALLLDEGILTELRTAAVGSLVAKYLAPPTQSSSSSYKIGMVGTGIQARYQLNMLKHVLDCRDVVLWGRTASKVEELKVDLESKGWKVQVVSTTAELVENCDLIVTTTCAKESLLEMIPQESKKALHITCIGADAPGKQELSVRLVEQADLLVADSLFQTGDRGEFQHVLNEKLKTQEDIVALGDFIKDSALHRKQDGSDHRVTIFDSSGVALQDCVIAEQTLRALQAKS